MAPTRNGEPTTGALRGGTPAKERTLRAQGRRTLRKFLDAGVTAFDRAGYHAARVDDIVEIAETSHGTFYLYFSSKEDLLRTLVEDAAGQLTALATELPTVERGDEGWQALRAWLEGFADLYTSIGPVVRAWTEADAHGGEFSRSGADLLGEFSDVLAARIGEANPDLDADLAAVMFVSMVERYLYLASAYEKRFAADRTNELDTMTSIVHAGIFGGQRTRRRGLLGLR